MAETPTCATCPYFDRHAPVLEDPPPRVVLGWCRMAPPTASRRWPIVESTDWCGQHPAHPAKVPIAEAPTS